MAESQRRVDPAHEFQALLAKYLDRLEKKGMFICAIFEKELRNVFGLRSDVATKKKIKQLLNEHGSHPVLEYYVKNQNVPGPSSEHGGCKKGNDDHADDQNSNDR